MTFSSRRITSSDGHRAFGTRLSKSALGRQLRSRHGPPQAKRNRGWRRDDRPYVPPEDWYEPVDDGPSLDSSEPDAAAVRFRVLKQEAGRGFRHVVTAEQVRDRLAQLPSHFVQPLDVVQLSRMTRKKQTYPCYGMQWGQAIYLYPLEESLVEFFARPPKPAERREATLFGGRWKPAGETGWLLIWTPQTASDFYLNNVLLHELGHLLDDRNSSYTDRERFAEWFAMEWGRRPKALRRGRNCRRRRVVRRRHGR